MVRPGERHEYKGVVLQILEVNPYRSFSGRTEYMVAYVIIDGKWRSPVAHFWLREREDPRPVIERIIDNYLQVKASLR